jgi:hypothetical protein
LLIRRSCILLALAVLASSCARAGVLISRSANSLQFSEAASVAVNNKDRVLTLGPEAKLTGPVGKLQGVKLEGTLLFDLPQGVVAMYSPQTVEYIFREGLPKDHGFTWPALHTEERAIDERLDGSPRPAQFRVLGVLSLNNGVPAMSKKCQLAYLFRVINESISLTD